MSERSFELESPEAVVLRFPLAELAARGVAFATDVGLILAATTNSAKHQPHAAKVTVDALPDDQGISPRRALARQPLRLPALRGLQFIR